MKTRYQYEPGTTRWRRHDGKSDVRTYRAPNGWEAFVHELGYHPITGIAFTEPQCWFEETFVGKH